ncbi:MAG: hypothetical protein LIP03_09395 [Bacteroidales bacterium]|nr:hypothetical protein [Bacteroidales bacterium]
MVLNYEALRQAQACYAALERFRRDRERNKRYNYGDQWSDIIQVDGRSVTEEEYIKEQGSVPLKNNLIRRLVRNVIGVFSSQGAHPVCEAVNAPDSAAAESATLALERNAQLNRLEALYVRTLEEFLIGGLIVHKKWYGHRQCAQCGGAAPGAMQCGSAAPGAMQCGSAAPGAMHSSLPCTDYVHPHNFFIDANMRDFRAWDCRCIGEVHDVDFPTLCAQFAHSAADCQQLAAIYGRTLGSDTGPDAFEDFGYGSDFSSGLLTPRNPGMCRVIELWRKEYMQLYRCHDPLTGRVFRIRAADYPKMVEAVNAQRSHSLISAQWLMQERWRYYFLAPTGHVLAQGESPYAHGAHPYVVKAYPLIDGEIHAFVGDVIDQQRYTNRLITMYDWIVRSSAKGVLLVPEDCVPRGVNPRDFADAWSRFNGVLVYKPSARGDAPRQVSGNAANVGITELLNLQLKFFEEISGVNGALEGRLANSAMSAELFDQQTQNATMALLDLLNTFYEFMRDAAQKDLSLLQQYGHLPTTPLSIKIEKRKRENVSTML